LYSALFVQLLKQMKIVSQDVRKSTKNISILISSRGCSTRIPTTAFRLHLAKACFHSPVTVAQSDRISRRKKNIQEMLYLY
jgi:hypothetical protein